MELTRRSTADELMDTEPVSFEEFRHCLRQLEAINRVSLAYRPTLAWLDRLADTGWASGQRPLSILDVGFGHGDMLRRIAAWAATRRLPVSLAGVDLVNWSAQAAASATPAETEIRYHVGDVFHWPDDRPVDVVVSSLFAHHLPDPDLVRFLRWMETRARIGWFVNDLHRHPVPQAVVGTLARLLPLNRLVRHDAPVSVARGFTRRDWDRLLAAADLPPERVSVAWYFPFRYGVGSIRCATRT